MTGKKGKRAFPGLHHFEDDPVDRQLFFGREKETRELTEKILAESITVLFGRSGDGKTSLIKAGIKQSLRQLGYFPVFARIFNDPATISPIKALYQTIELQANSNNIFLPVAWQKPTLWETCYHLRPIEKNQLQPMVLIFDHFEELFTIMADWDKEKNDFIKQFSDLVRGRLPDEVKERLQTQLDIQETGEFELLEIENLLFNSASTGVRVVLSLREDYLAFLENLGEFIPTVYDSRYRLLPLSRAAAREAITNPPKQALLGQYTFNIAPEAVESMLQFLTGESSRSGWSDQFVGPPQLQILCQQLEEQMRQDGRHSISLDHLGGENGMSRLISHYYRDIIKKFPLLRFGWRHTKKRGFFRVLPIHSPLLLARKLCEERLITAGGSRNSRHEDEIITEIGVPKGDLDTLVECRLLRREPRKKEAFYELSHDSLVPSLQQAGKHRQRSIMMLKLFCFALFIVLIARWSYYYFLGKLRVEELKKTLILVRNGEIAVEAFKDQLNRVKRYSSDWLDVINIESEFYRWRLETLEKATLRLDVPPISGLIDTVRQKKVQEVLIRYSQIIETDSSVFVESRMSKAEMLLDSASISLGGDPRITALQADLADKRGDFQRRDELFREAERTWETVQRLSLRVRETGLGSETIRNLLLASIKLQNSQNMRVKGDTLGQPMAVKLALVPEKALQGTLIRLNGQEVKNNYGYVIIPPDVQKVEATIQVTNKEGIEVAKPFTLEIDRLPPHLIYFNIYSRNSESENWSLLLSKDWKGTFWRIKGEASEPLQFCSAELILTKGIRQIFTPRLLKNKREFVFEGNSNTFSNSASLLWKLDLIDLVGWKNTVILGKWGQELPQSDITASIRSRGEPTVISAEDAFHLLKKQGFSDSLQTIRFRDYFNQFEEIIIQKDKIIVDHASRLTWQQSGSTESMESMEAVQNYINEINTKKYAGYDDWRLPTIEEAMTLVEIERKNGMLYIDPVFDGKQEWIWTSDQASDGRVWFANFHLGARSRHAGKASGFVRAAR